MRRLRAFRIGIACTLVASAPAFAASDEAWRSVHGTDPVTDAVTHGAVYESGPDKLIFVCTRTGSQRDFTLRVLTTRRLGRGGRRNVIYRLGDGRPRTEEWSYTSRTAEPALNMLSRMTAREVVRSTADRMIVRFYDREDRGYDITAPLDGKSRETLRAVMATCGVEA